MLADIDGGTMYDPSTQHPNFVTLAYGRTLRRAGFASVSCVSGVTCTNRAGHGLFLSRQSWCAF